MKSTPSRKSSPHSTVSTLSARRSVLRYNKRTTAFHATFSVAKGSCWADLKRANGFFCRASGFVELKTRGQYVDVRLILSLITGPKELATLRANLPFVVTVGGQPKRKER